MASHPFDAAVRLRPAGEHFYGAETSEPYGNFVGPFGGITAAIAVRAMLLHPLRRGIPLSLTLHFAAPIRDGSFLVRAAPQRTNRSTQHWRLELAQDGAVAIFGSALWGVRRSAWSSRELEPPPVPQPEALARADGSGREPCVERYEMRFVEGGFPTEWHGADTGSSVTRLWVRDDPPRPLDFGSLAALSDVFFPRIWRRRPRKVPVGTVVMTLHFHATPESLARAGEDFLLGSIQSHGFREGYCDQTAHLWNRAGELLLTAHQVAYYRQ